MKKTTLLLLILGLCLYAAPKGTSSTNWTYGVQVTVELPDGSAPTGANNMPAPDGNADRASAGGYCSWMDEGLYFECWISKFVEEVVSDTFFPGDQSGYNHRYGRRPWGVGYYEFNMDNFTDVGRMNNFELAINDTLHIRLMVPVEGIPTYYWKLDTVFSADPGGLVEILAELLTYVDYSTFYGNVPEDDDFCFTGAIDEKPTNLLPQDYDLAQNSPNPFNSATEIQYAIPEDAEVTVEVFDITGHKVKSLVSTRQSAGYYSVKWDGTDDGHEIVATGTYFYHIRAGEFEAKKRMLYIK